ncbi:MAG: secondary thiamine-phosphate synthase enzyme YjbQ, partial [Gemmatimonadota bacterium]
MVHTESFTVATKGFCDILDISDRVAEVAARSGVADGTVTVFCPGSTCSVTTIEYESGVLRDLRRAIEEIVPQDREYAHDKRWGDGNGFSHVRAALLKPSLGIPLVGSRLALGTWQQVVLIDFDNRDRRREIVVQVVG